MTPDNPYRRLTGDEMALCKPLLTDDELTEILLQVSARVFQLLGEGPKARVFTDLEHLQVVDYRVLGGLVDLRCKRDTSIECCESDASIHAGQ